MVKKTTGTIKKQSKRKVKVGKLQRTEKQLDDEELKGVEGAGIISAATNIVRGAEDAIGGVAHTAGSVASSVLKGIKDAIK